MTSSKAVKKLLPFFCLFLAAAACAGESRQTAQVEKALTGDTVRLKSGKLLRYIGVDAYPAQSKDLLIRGYGEKALGFNDSLVAGKTVRVEWGSKLRDDQGRFLGYVYLDDGRFVNRELLAAGHAKARLAPPNLGHAAELRGAEREARRHRRGIWEKEPASAAQSVYIGEKNTKIFYFPDSPELERIPEAQWVRFRSRVEAKAAGYRPCFSCREGSANADAE